MKKILSFALIFVLSLSVYSTLDVKADAVGDVTINFHIHQFDGDYTNTGLGIWDGVDWHGFVDVATSTDDFGAVISKTWTADKVNDAAFLADMQVKPSSNGDDANNYLAPASIGGQPTLDVSSLIDGTKTELNVYYVEGALSFYSAMNDNGLFMNVFVNPGVAADATAYDGWGMHTWNNGPGGSSATWDEPIPYSIDMEIQVGEYLVPMKLGVLEVGAGATVESGFIVHSGDSKAFPDDIIYDGAALLDDVNGNKAQVAFYEFGLGEFTADYSTFLTNVEASFKDNLKNKFMDAKILTPESLTVTMLTPKSPFDLMSDRFTVTDSSITAIDYGVTPAFAPVATDVVIEFQTYVRVYVDTDLANVALVGAFQGWDITSTVAPVGTFEGYQVFEISTNTMDFAYAVVAHDRVDDTETADVDEAAFSWDDKISGDDNLVLELTPGAVSHSVFVDATDSYYQLDALEAMPVDVANYTYTSAVTCTAGTNLLTFILSTDMDTTDLTMFGLVGTPQKSGYDATLNDGAGGFTTGDWNPGAAINPTGLDADGNLVFEVCIDTLGMDLTAGTEDDPLHQEFKILYSGADDPLTLDVDESLFAWGDAELTPQVVFDFAAEAGTAMAMAFNAEMITTDFDAYVATIEVSNTYRYTLYLNAGDLDAADFAVVGAFDENAWDPSNPMTFTMMDSEGNYYIDFEIHSKDFEYKVLYNAIEDDPLTTEVNEAAFDWAHSIFGNDNSKSELGELSYKADMISYTMVEEVMTFAKESLMDATTTTMTLKFADDTFMYGTDYTVTYVEAYGDGGEVLDTVISMEELGFALSNDFVPGDEVAQTGTYALLPTKIAVVFTNVADINAEMGVKLLGAAGNEIMIESIKPIYSMGTYTPTLTTCPAGSEMLTVYVQTTEDTSDLTVFGLVGTPQQSGYDATLNDGDGGWTNGGWNPAAAITPTGLDSNGNLVFEICVETLGMDLTADTEDDATHQEFKVLFDNGDDADTADVDESGFNWGDPELTAQVVFDFDGPEVMMVQEGLGRNESFEFMYMLSDANKLRAYGSYMLEYTDANGFVVTYDVIIDAEDPAVDVSKTTGVELEIDNDAESFNLMDYFSILRFVDNYDGELAYTIDSTIDFSMSGEQNVVVSATDSWGNKATETFVFTVNDVIAPVITLEAAPTFETGTTVPDWNEYVTVEGGTLVINATQVDMSNAGEFYVVFTATDEAGNTTTENLKVTMTAATIVIDPDDVKEVTTGCFGSVGVGFAVVALMSVIGTAAFVAIRKR